MVEGMSVYNHLISADFPLWTRQDFLYSLNTTENEQFHSLLGPRILAGCKIAAGGCRNAAIFYLTVCYGFIAMADPSP